MAKPKNITFSLKEKVEKLKMAGFSTESGIRKDKIDDEELLPLTERIRLMLKIIQSAPLKATLMNYIILYDIEKNKIRRLVAKYLLQSGCVRIQKSVFLLNGTHKKFDEIRETLAEINEFYENSDSIILIPLNVSDARSMKLIGKNVNIHQIVDRPNTIFI